MTIRRIAALLVVAALLAPTPVFAGCSNPVGVAGDQFYNTTYNVMQFCNGSGWINMGVNVSGGIGTLTSPDLCTTDGLNVNCTTSTPLAVTLGGTGASTLAGLISLTADISGVLAVTNGGTGVSLAQGNGTKVQLSSGSITSGDCVKFDANGNTVDTGAGCGAVGGSASLANGDIWIGNASSVATATALPLSAANGGTGDSTLTANALLYGNGTSAVQAVGSGTVTTYTTSNCTGAGNTCTWTKPSTGALVLLQCWGGGGGGGGDASGAISFAGGGGGGGAYDQILLPMAAMNSTETVTIGAGGAGGASDSDGGNGGTSSFGSHLYAMGGMGGGGDAGAMGTAWGGGGGQPGGGQGFGYYGAVWHRGGSGSTTAYEGGAGSASCGGGGGGIMTNSGVSLVGGTSNCGGNGGGASSGAGTAPGGGGAAGRNVSGAAGAAGQCQITVY